MERYKQDISSVPYDVRQFMPNRCCWLQMNAMQGRKQINASGPEVYDVGEHVAIVLSGTTAPTLTHVVNTGQEPPSYLQIAPANASNSRGIIGHRRDITASDGYRFGVCESDVTARVRYADTDTTGTHAFAAVGFLQGLNLLSAQTLCAAFTTNGLLKWAVTIVSGGVTVTYDTGISSDTWRDLSVWVSADAKTAVFSIDGVPVYSLATSQIAQLNTGSSTGAAAIVRRLSQSTARSLQVAWYVERHFINR
jgi:hypothetical protein